MAIHTRRRYFIVALGGAAAWPLVTRAQQPDRVRRIGVLMGYAESDSDAQAWYAAFQEGLQRLGWTAGRNTRIDARWATPDDVELMRRFAQELVALQPDIILSSTTPTTSALLQQTHTIPIVFAIVADPIGSGFVANFARPGGNVNRFHLYGADDGRQVAGTAQGDCTAHYPGCYAIQPDIGDLCRILAETLQSSRSIIRRGGDNSACS
jgi:ABC-type uncharacterized transport system substrate-binding protein